MNDGGQAFPGQIVTRGSDGSKYFEHPHGMSLWHYYAAHAPTEVPEWFRPDQKTISEPPHGAAWCESCKAGADCERTDACVKMRTWVDYRNGTKEFNKWWAYFQWRFTYADGMITEANRRNLISTPQPTGGKSPDTANA